MGVFVGDVWEGQAKAEGAGPQDHHPWVHKTVLNLGGAGQVALARAVELAEAPSQSRSSTVTSRSSPASRGARHGPTDKRGRRLSRTPRRRGRGRPFRASSGTVSERTIAERDRGLAA